MNDTQRGIRRRRNAAGFSVVEVLVAISLLVVGIVAILELFPPGFSAINHTKNVTLAAQVASAYFEELKQLNLDQIGVIASQYNPMSDNTAAAFNLADNSVDTVQSEPNHNINSERIVGGELTRIPQNLYSVTNTATYTVNFGPIDVASGYGGSALAVNGSPWTGTAGVAYVGTSHSESGILSPVQYIPALVLSRDQPQYLIDYNQGAVALPMEQSMWPSGSSGGYVQVVHFSIIAGDGIRYSTTINWDNSSTGKGVYWDNDTVVDPSTDVQDAEPLWFSPNPGPGNTWLDPNGNPVPAPTGSTQLPWVNGSAVVGRNFAEVPLWSPSAPPSDPYVFALNLGNIGGTNANPGVIAFDPAATLLRDGSGKTPQIKVTYWVADWHVVREDHTVTSIGSIRLSLGSVAQIGDTLMPPVTSSNGTVLYGGVYHGILDHAYDPVDPTSTGTLTPETYVIDLDNGVELRQVADYALNARLYSTGVVTLVSPTTYLNAHLRIYYRSRGDWSLNVLKSPAFYTPNAQLVNAGSPPANTLTNVATYQVSADGTGLLFPLTDVGKMVQINGVHVVTGGVKSVINDASVYGIESPNPTMLAAGLNMGYVDFATDASMPQGNGSGASILFGPGETIDASLPNPVDQVEGASVTVRVVYYEQGRQRYSDFESFLAPGQSI